MARCLSGGLGKTSRGRRDSLQRARRLPIRDSAAEIYSAAFGLSRSFSAQCDFASWAFGGDAAQTHCYGRHISKKPIRLTPSQELFRKDDSTSLGSVSTSRITPLAPKLEERYAHDGTSALMRFYRDGESPSSPKASARLRGVRSRRLAVRHTNVVGLIAGGEIVGDEAYRLRIEAEIALSGLGRRLRAG